ncbi:tyrosine-type recombinase/integrase [Lichenifustis flavocetrariae]|uniref:Tyrosine-type recombinase/integrase n=1 Tax=Lichenifustis flavocetrariae TaxID=2949735 RepID=A0AA42CS04_9HYPH|nr:tyrosine-type recombinase/integrase [Lichenifustis flavocetrariae]MCW6512995.1 tyrosine-type recombinase/integrase [Lichenifustis flavocetrariae]
MDGAWDLLSSQTVSYGFIPYKYNPYHERTKNRPARGSFMQHKGRYVTLTAMIKYGSHVPNTDPANKPIKPADPARAVAKIKSLPLATVDQSGAFGRPIIVPALVAGAGPRASKRFANFFGSIANDNTRAAYQRACLCFFDWCDRNGIPDLGDIEPIHVGAYLKSMADGFEKPTIKQHLAAIRMLFDYLVTGQVIALNPAHSVRAPKHVIKRGKTPVLVPDEARRLLDSIDTSTLIGLRDRALIALMAYSFARVGAAVAMRVEDYYGQGKRWWVRLHEKGGKVHEMPCHHNLEHYLDAYLHAAGIQEAKKSPLFRSVRGRTGLLTEEALHRVDTYRMVVRRAKAAGVSAAIGCHTFRATGITAYLENGGTLENAQTMAAHESPRTTKLYDRTSDQITLDEVERIVI